MPSIQVKHVPAEVHETLRRRAAADGRSLQDYLLALLGEEAARPTIAEVLERAGQRDGGAAGFDVAVEAIRSDREAR